MSKSSSTLQQETGRSTSLRGGLSLAVVGLAVAVAGCTTIQTPVIVGSVPEDYRTTHPIAIDESIETLDVPVGLNTGRMSIGERANVQGLAQRFLASGSSVLAIVSPKGSPNQNVAAAISFEIQDVLVASGVSPRAIDMRIYRAGAGENTAPVRIAFARVSAKTAPCGPWPDQVADTSQNRHYFNYGCATQQNMAAIVANPLDLLYPRGMTPADAARRAVVLQNYRNGAPYQSDYSKQVGSAVIAQGVGN